MAQQTLKEVTIRYEGACRNLQSAALNASDRLISNNRPWHLKKSARETADPSMILPWLDRNQDVYIHSAVEEGRAKNKGKRSVHPEYGDL